MKKIAKYILTTLALLVILLPFVSSCSDDKEVSEWDMNYVSLMPTDHLKPIQTFSLRDVEDIGIEENVEFEFVASILKTSEQDIMVNIDVQSEKISPENIQLTSKTALIKAGATRSEAITLNISNWSDFAEIKEEVEETLKISISSIDAQDSDIRLSEMYDEIGLKIVKSERKPREVRLLRNVTDWTFTFMDGVENPGSNTVAGTGGSDVATNGVPFWFTVDLGEVKDIVGVLTQHWGAAFAPTKVELFISENNSDWTSVGVFDTSGGTQTIQFEKQFKTRYVKYQMITVPSRVDITRFYIYALE